MKKTLFCANCQAKTDHSFTLSANGSEYVGACDCGRVVKFPASLTVEELRAAFLAHEASNQGQVKVDPAAEAAKEAAAMKALEDA